jgi:hypothetical protein
VLPLVLALFAIPERGVGLGLAPAVAAVLVVAVATGGVPNLIRSGQYVGFRGPETRCLDEAVPGQVGFATFSDARRVGLPSATGIRLVPVTADLEPNLWLTNRAYARDERPTFLYVDERGDERALDGDVIHALFGEPDRVVECAEGQRVLVYAHPLNLG